jgi:hypothetical protein
VLRVHRQAAAEGKNENTFGMLAKRKKKKAKRKTSNVNYIFG